LSLYLADACALIDFYTEEAAFPRGLRGLIEDRTAEIAVAAVTVWEIAIKTAKGRLVDLRAPSHPTLAGMLRAHGYAMLPFDHATAEQAANLPPLHGDPFDRALVATAQRTGRTVLTSDAIIGRYGVPVRW
jgi:PIN domain nuclease of toxin-antitoxin system